MSLSKSFPFIAKKVMLLTSLNKIVDIIQQTNQFEICFNIFYFKFISFHALLLDNHFLQGKICTSSNVLTRFKVDTY